MKVYSDIPHSQIEAQKRYFYGAIISCLYQKEDNDPSLDAHIQTIINQIRGSNKLFNYQPEVLTDDDNGSCSGDDDLVLPTFLRDRNF